MVSGDVPIGDWLHQGTSDAREVAERYDEWAPSYEADLASIDTWMKADEVELRRGLNKPSGTN